MSRLRRDLAQSRQADCPSDVTECVLLTMSAYRWQSDAGQGSFGSADASATSSAIASATAQAIASAVAQASNSKSFLSQAASAHQGF